MKKLSILILLSLLVLACDPDDGPPIPVPTEVAFEKLSGDWTLNNGAGSIVVDGTDVSANYAGFSLSFTNGGYTTINAADLFRASGTWDWADEGARMIDLDDGKEIDIVLLNPNRFTFTFTLTDGNSANGIAGNYTVSVVK